MQVVSIVPANMIYMMRAFFCFSAIIWLRGFTRARQSFALHYSMRRRATPFTRTRWVLQDSALLGANTLDLISYDHCDILIFFLALRWARHMRKPKRAQSI